MLIFASPCTRCIARASLRVPVAGACCVGCAGRSVRYRSLLPALVRCTISYPSLARHERHAAEMSIRAGEQFEVSKGCALRRSTNMWANKGATLFFGTQIYFFRHFLPDAHTHIASFSPMVSTRMRKTLCEHRAADKARTPTLRS